MKLLFSSLMVIIMVSVVFSCSKPLSTNYGSETTDKEQNVAIQEESDRDLYKPIEEALLERGKATYSDVVVYGEEVNIYIRNIQALIFFRDNAVKQARLDLKLFLALSGGKTGTIYYYDHLKRIMFSISGDSSNIQTKMYY